MERRKALLGDIAGEKDRFCRDRQKAEDSERDVARAAEEEKGAFPVLRRRQEEWEQYRKRIEERSDRIMTFGRKGPPVRQPWNQPVQKKGVCLSLLDVLREISRSEESVKEARKDLGRLREEILQKRSLEEAAGNRQRDVFAAFPAGGPHRSETFQGDYPPLRVRWRPAGRQPLQGSIRPRYST
jgi:DNA repair exonuclease SbcCD ATPase subunit